MDRRQLLTALISASAAGGEHDSHQEPSIVFDARGGRRSLTRGEWPARRERILAGMQLVMGPLPNRSRKRPPETHLLEEVRLDGLLRRKLTYQSDDGPPVPAYLFLPEGRARRAAVLCLQQTTDVGAKEPAGLAGSPDMAYALELARRGFVTLAPDFPGFGEYRYEFAPTHDYVSGTMKAIWDNLRAVDLLRSMPEVHPERLGVIGHSLGGHMALFTAPFEPRLKAIVSSCGFTRFHRDDMPSWAGPRYMPRIASVYRNDADRIPFDFPEVLAAPAPRALLACAARCDNDFAIRGVRETVDAARPVYEVHGRGDRLALHEWDGPHGFPTAAREVAYRFLERHLK
jgi:dienelactone hydrolase